MSNIPVPNPNSEANEYRIFKFPDIIDELGNIGTESDLQSLRQLSLDYYELLNSIYLAGVEKKSIWIHQRRYTCPSGCRCSVCLEETKDTIAILDYAGNPEQKITKQNWIPKNAYLFDKLVLWDIWFNRMEIYTDDRIRIPTLISQVAPYISTVTLHKLPVFSDLRKPGDRLIKLFKRFKNLKNVNITYTSHEKVGQNLVRRTISVAELGKLLRHFDERNIKIKLEVLNNHMAVLGAFKNSLTNLSYVLFLGGTQDVILQLFALTIIIDVANLDNIKYNLAFKDITSIYELESITSTCILNRNFIEELSLEIDLTIFENSEQEVVKQNLIQLSPLITTFYIAEVDRADKWNLFNEAIYDWSKLDTLSICTFEEHLHILKQCPKLKTLCLKFIGSEPCRLFENNLKEYFLQLSHLNKLCYFNPSGHPGSSQELETYLKELLPPNTFFNNMLKNY